MTCQRRHQPFVQLQHNMELQLFTAWGISAWTYELPKQKAEWDWLCNSFFFFPSAVIVFHNLNCQKQSGHAAVSFNSILLYNWMTHCTAARDLGNRSLSWALIPSFLSQGERSDTGRRSWWILRFHRPMLLWAVWGLELYCLERVCTGATPAWGSPAPA